ncbi:VPS10 2 like [Melia azedarach]|uniref:VPS10 2 like n=1 Tax=Melia azedarach TaxID=155640 RepID=A0ACC1YAS6_MELAZ|nr:VPS10 2 like [Melia azedarach]
MEDQQRFMILPQREGGEVEESDQEDAISLCDLLVDHCQESEYDSYQQLSNEDDSFEFSFDTSFNSTDQNDADTVDKNSNAINFCRETVSYSGNKQQQVPDSPVYYLNNKRRSSNTPVTRRYRQDCYASNSRSRRHKVLIGLAKVPTVMELSDIKKRQSKRRNPAPMLPVTAGGCELAVAGDNNGYQGRRNHWSLVRSLKCGAQFAGVLTKTAFGCFSVVRLRG